MGNCPDGEEYDAELCYSTCKTGYNGEATSMTLDYFTRSLKHTEEEEVVGTNTTILCQEITVL